MSYKSIMRTFLKENWFKISVALILLWIGLTYAKINGAWPYDECGVFLGDGSPCIEIDF